MIWIENKMNETGTMVNPLYWGHCLGKLCPGNLSSCGDFVNMLIIKFLKVFLMAVIYCMKIRPISFTETIQFIKNIIQRGAFCCYFTIRRG